MWSELTSEPCLHAFCHHRSCFRAICDDYIESHYCLLVGCPGFDQNAALNAASAERSNWNLSTAIDCRRVRSVSCSLASEAFGAMTYALSRFDPTQGPKIVHQVPEGVIATALNAFPTRTEDPAPVSNTEAPSISQGLIRSTSGQGIGSAQVLFDFSSVLEFVIPKPELCGNLITKATRTSKILGFPVRYFAPFLLLLFVRNILTLIVPEFSTRKSITKVVMSTTGTPSYLTCASYLNAMQNYLDSSL